MDMKHEKKKMLFVVLGILLIPLSTNILLPSKRFSDLENRVLTEEIRWDEDLLKSGVLAERVEAYVQDQFPLRDLLINLKSDVEVLLGKEENNGVYKGQDGYLFAKPEVYDEKTLADNIEAMSSLSEKLNSSLAVMLAPPSSMVLEEKLPSFVDAELEKAYYELILKGISESQVVPVLEKLMEKSQEEVYFRTDHHWTQYGAYVAYEELMHTLSLDAVDNSAYTVHKTSGFQGTLYSRFRGTFVEGEDFVLYESEGQKYQVEYVAEDRLEDRILFRENLETRDMYKVYLDGNPPLIKILNPEAEYQEKVLVLKDSYANAMAPYLAESFGEVHFMDLRYFNLSLEEYLEKEEFSRVILLYGMDSIGEDTNLRKLAY